MDEDGYLAVTNVFGDDITEIPQEDEYPTEYINCLEVIDEEEVK